MSNQQSVISGQLLALIVPLTLSEPYLPRRDGVFLFEGKVHYNLRGSARATQARRQSPKAHLAQFLAHEDTGNREPDGTKTAITLMLDAEQVRPQQR